MIAELGFFTLLLAFAAALAGTVPLLRPVYIHDGAWQRTARLAGQGAFALIAAAFVLLTICFVRDDFSVALVAGHSHTLQPLMYKIAGVWGNHEGSLLLWLLVLGGCGAKLKNVRMQVVLNALLSIFLALSIFTSNPFARLFPTPSDGSDLNPLLQDPGLVIHPPLLYVGYVGMALVFAAAVAALWEAKFDAIAARRLRHWALLAWSFLTAGLALGSWWAYYELGWGGWWFWDPVENAALVPWLVGAALVHSARTAEVTLQRGQGAMLRWTLLLAIICFALSLLGTFLVRSGILTSVHAFASDPLRGLALLAIFAVCIGGAFALLAVRWNDLPQSHIVKPLSREGMLLLNNIFLSAAAATVLIGTLYPLALDALSLPPITVGPPYFMGTFVPIMLPLALLLAVGQVLPWNAAQNIRKHAITVALVMLGVAFAYLSFIADINPLPLLGFAVGAAVVAGTAANFRRMQVGQLLAHIGLGICLMGMAGTALGHEKLLQAQAGERIAFAGYDLKVERLYNNAADNYIATGVSIDVQAGGDYVTRLATERRYYPVADQWTTEAAIHTTVLGDLFIATGPESDGLVNLRLRWQPLQVWIWIGALLILLGGLAAFWKQRGQA